MTPQEFGAAVESLGIRTIPDVNIHDEGIQYKALLDPQNYDRASITQVEGCHLSNWASGKRVVEIGTGIGISTVCLAHTAASVVTIDPNEWVRTSLALPANVKQLEKFSEIRGCFDFGFIDGLHDKYSVMRDIVNMLQVVLPGGHIAFHDVNMETVEAAIKAFNWSSIETMPTVGKITRCGVPA